MDLNCLFFPHAVVIRMVHCRGRVLLPAFRDILSEEVCPEVEGLEIREGYIQGTVKQAEGYFKEVKTWKQRREG